MFDVSWGELFVMTGLSLAVIGRRDLPKAARFAGGQVGRVVGLLQGARVRADRFAQQNELRQLQNQLRAGLRELDAVKAEIATSTSGAIVGRGLGATVGNVNRRMMKQNEARMNESTRVSNHDSVGTPLTGTSTHSVQNAPFDFSADANNRSSEEPGSRPVLGRTLAPRSQSVAAVAEEEWNNRGMGFQSRAESSDEPSGSKLLANLLQQTLIHDQYDRTVQEQQEALQSKADRIQERIRYEKRDD
jgi:Sec-independent protein translocase protein TatA